MKANIVSKRVAAVIFISLLISSQLFSSVSAARITIAPSFKDIQIDSQSLTDVPIRLTNASSAELTFLVEAQDFGAIDDNGGISLNVNDSYKYGLKDYLLLDTNQITIGPHKTGTVIATISNTANLTPGGHYGAVIFTLKDGNTSQIPVKQTITSLLFVSKKGGNGAKLSPVKLDFQASLFKLPEKVELTVANMGNVHAAPTGTVLVKDPWTHVLFTGEINTVNGKVLPETIRKFVLDVNAKRSALPGKYTLQVSANGETISRGFFVFPITSLIATSLTLMVMLIAVIIFRKKLAIFLKKLLHMRKGLFKNRHS